MQILICSIALLIPPSVLTQSHEAHAPGATSQTTDSKAPGTAPAQADTERNRQLANIDRRLFYLRIVLVDARRIWMAVKSRPGEDETNPSKELKDLADRVSEVEKLIKEALAEQARLRKERHGQK